MSISQYSSEPGVIDNEMIQKALDDQGPTGEARRLLKEDGWVLEDIESLRLEFLNILRIDHLWMMTSLVKLHLGNNVIEKIENLEMLVNLKELDLSFNNIEKIENLDNLVKLEVLTLFQNKISKIENIDCLTNLIIFSIGNNDIQEWDNVLYLRKFPNLRTLNMSGNPCVEKQDFYSYICAFLPKLVYYEYKMITKAERQKGCEIFASPLEKLEDEERKQEKERKKKEEEYKAYQHYLEAFVEDLDKDQFFFKLFENDIDGKVLVTINEEATDTYNIYHDQVLEVTQLMFTYGLNQHEIRQKEIKEFKESVTEAKERAREKSRKIVNDFLGGKTDIFMRIRKLLQLVESQTDDDITDHMETMQKYTDEFNDLCQNVWYQLMEEEIILYEQVEDTNNNFERSLNDVKDQFIEQQRSNFTQCRELESNFAEQLGDIAYQFLTNLKVKAEEKAVVIPPELSSIMASKDSLNNSLSTSHDYHLQVIDTREDVMVKRINVWCNEYCSKLQEEEILRNRNKVAEINHFIDIQREEFEELRNTLLGTDHLLQDVTT